MRHFHFLVKLSTLGSLCVFLLACSSTPTFNATTFPYQINEQRLAERPIKRVVIAHVNLGAGSRNYLERVAPRIDGYITSYLKENGFKVIPQREFEQNWNMAERVYGNPVDPTTGKVNMKAFSQIMQSVRDEMAKTSKPDAFIFTDLLEFEVAFTGGMKHLARWDGVARKPSLQGPGSGVSSDFDWNTQASVASLQVTIFDTELQRLFISRGGLDTTDAIDTRSSKARFVRRRSILENRDNVMEGIQLAFHPFIPFKDWPGKK